MKIEFEVPDGEYCGDCRMLAITEMECSPALDGCKLSGLGMCRLFGDKISCDPKHGMAKCPACKEAAHE